ncbi:MAG: ImmA/IrrE family metallo-endopeptidase [Deltaproteobacteria bacterium]|nr:ImmA/IrrE family metallo-endopeptidase [Deltaproteobacteria bacterium]
MIRVEVKPELLRWALDRAGRSIESLRNKFPKIEQWIRGEVKPTLKQLEKFAKTVCVPMGYLFLPSPPEERIPIPDLRTLPNQGISRPSPDLLDTIYAMQRRQAWLREELLECEAEPLYFAGSARLTDDPEAVGKEMRRIVGLDQGWAMNVRTWTDAVGELRRAIEKLGVMAIINGVVGNNTRRKLNVEEFRGFALSDEYAPLVFVNGADAKSAQMFTLAHELAHIWLGESALTDTGLVSRPSQDIEKWCDRAAAEFLVPAQELKVCWRNFRREGAPFEAIARHFKVSPIVIGRRAMNLRLVDREAFFAFYKEYMERERTRRPYTGGGDYYNNQNTRVGEFFAVYVIGAAMEGRLSFKEAYDLTGLRGGTFQEYTQRLGFDLP